MKFWVVCKFVWFGDKPFVMYLHSFDIDLGPILVVGSKNAHHYKDRDTARMVADSLDGNTSDGKRGDWFILSGYTEKRG